MSQPLAEGRLKKGTDCFESDYLAEDPEEITDTGETTYFKSVGMDSLMCVLHRKY